MKTTTATGTLELRDAYQKNLAGGLFTAGLFHLMVFTALLMNSDAVEQNDRVIICTFPPFMKPQMFENYILQPRIEPKISLNNNSFGIPIPIPDPEFNPETTVAVADPTGSPGGTVTGSEPGNGTGETDGNGTIDEDIRPEDFTPGVEKYPMILMNPAPHYPDLARRAGIEGTVYVKMWIAKDGTVKSVEVVKSNSEIFDRPAVEAAAKWKFTPAIMNGKPVSVFVTVPFKFRLAAS